VQRLIPTKSLVAVVDVQERLAAVMPAPRMAHVVQKTMILLSAAELLGAPIIATQQYPKGLGPTVPELDQKLNEVRARRLDKLAFSAFAAPEFASFVAEMKPAAVIVVGMETHICVFQTVRDLVAQGIEVHVPVDAVVSRREDDRAAGMALCERAGAIPTSVEAVVFDWLERAGTDAFRAIAKLVR
jgi:nicotinamidase-related amidase